MLPRHVGSICSCEELAWSAIWVYSYGSAYIDDYLLRFVAELTKEVYVVTNELKTKCHCQQAPGLAVQEF